MVFPAGFARFVRRVLCAGMLSLVGTAVAVAQGQWIDTGGNWTWTTIDQATCMTRAAATMQAAANNFQLGTGQVNPAGWYIGLTGPGDVQAGIHCVPDDDTANLVGPSARRVLVVVTFSSTRGGVTSGQFLQYVHQCMQTGACTPAAGSLVGNWFHPGGWGDISIWDDGGGRFRGTYTAQCPGATRVGQFELELVRTAQGDRYRGRWGEDVCSGEITSIEIRADGTAVVTNSWLVNRSIPNFQPLPPTVNPLIWGRR